MQFENVFAVKTSHKKTVFDTKRLQNTATRRRQRRIVDLEPCAIDWLKKGVLRHTAASMMIAKHKDVAEVSLQLGNSPDILFRHYRELVTKEAAESFWKIMPTV